MVLSPDRQTLLTVVAGTVMGMPALAAAWRAVIWPVPAWRTWPMKHVVDLVGATPARSRAAAMAKPPEVHGAEAGQGARELADRGAGPCDDDGTGHDDLRAAAARRP